MPHSKPTLVELQADHRHWLREVERWESNLDLWTSEQSLFVKEIARLQQVIQAHGSELQKHASALKAVKEEIVASEREMAGRQGPEIAATLAEAHSKIEGKHAAQRDLHERIKRIHHTLTTQLATCKREPHYDK